MLFFQRRELAHARDGAAIEAILDTLKTLSKLGHLRLDLVVLQPGLHHGIPSCLALGSELCEISFALKLGRDLAIGETLFRELAIDCLKVEERFGCVQDDNLTPSR